MNWVNRSVDWWSVFGGLGGKMVVVGGSVVGIFNKIPFLGTAYLLNFVNSVEMT